MADKKNISIKLTDVSKSYELFRTSSVSETFFRKTKPITHTVLKAINFTANPGDAIGIIGPNGTGKTTLLKIIAGITHPDEGSLVVKGKIASIINIDAGFHPDLTGRENIQLHGVLLGLKRNEIKRKMSKIITFSGLNKQIDDPLFTFSQGMKLRLGFSVLVHSNPEIIVLDESMAAGDESFHRKARKTLKKFIKEGGILVVVTHWQPFLDDYCNKIYKFSKTGQFRLFKKRK